MCNFGSRFNLVPKTVFYHRAPTNKINVTRFDACHFSKENKREPLLMYLMDASQTIFFIFSQKVGNSQIVQNFVCVSAMI